MTGISVTSPEDKPTREQQVARLTNLIPADGRAKLRISVAMFDEESKQYPPLRDTAWMISIPKAALEDTTIGDLLDQLGASIRALPTTVTEGGQA